MAYTTRTLLAGGTTLLAALVLSACGRAPKAAAIETASAPMPVAVAKTTIVDVADTFDESGTVRARTTAVVAARILAPVQDVRVSPGDRVRAGQVLVVLDGRDLDDRARSARAGIQSAERRGEAAVAEQQAADAALILARATHARIADLHAKRSATTQELDEAVAALRGAEAHARGAAADAQGATAGVMAARAAADASATTADFARLVAPFDGVVTEKLVEPGNMASPGTPLLRLEDIGHYRLDVRVDESRARHIATGTIVPVALDAGPANPQTIVKGTVLEVARTVDTNSRAFLVKILLPLGTDTRSGTFGRAHFGAATRRALTVAPDALVLRGQLTSVFVVDKGIARLRLVQVAGTEVLAGLEAGEDVVLAPSPLLTDGARVRLGGGR